MIVRPNFAHRCILAWQTKVVNMVSNFLLQKVFKPFFFTAKWGLFCEATIQNTGKNSATPILKNIRTHEMANPGYLDFSRFLTTFPHLNEFRGIFRN